MKIFEEMFSGELGTNKGFRGERGERISTGTGGKDLSEEFGEHLRGGKALGKGGKDLNRERAGKILGRKGRRSGEKRP